VRRAWFGGLKWKDVFCKGNAAGMAGGQADFRTQLVSGHDGRNTTPRRNFVWNGG